VPLVIDNTFRIAVPMPPIEHGADIVVHSATKFNRRPWHLDRRVIVDSANSRGTKGIIRTSRKPASNTTA